MSNNQFIFLLVPSFLPDDYVNQFHSGFIQAVKEVPQWFSFVLHTAQDEAKGNAEGQ